MTSSIAFLLGINALGGGELSMLAVAKGLRKAGYDVTVVFYGTHRHLMAQAANDLPLMEIPKRRTHAVILPFCRYLRQKRPRIVISALRHTNIAALIAARLSGSGANVILTEHSAGYYELSQRLVRPLVNLFYPRADAVVAVSQGIADELKGMQKNSKVHVIYNPVVAEMVETSAIPHAWLADDEPPVVMGIGRLKPEKDFTLLMRAFAIAHKSRPMRLILLGEGEERAELEVLARTLGLENDVLLPGFVTNTHDWLKHAQLFISSSRFEGFGNVIVEAMDARVPVIATDCPVGPREILDNGRFGILVPRDDASAMAAAMIEALRHPPSSDAAYARAQQFTVKRCIEAYAKLIDSLPLKPSLWQRIRRKITSIVMQENWMIGIVDAPIHESLFWKTCPQVQWLGERSRKRYLADPFAWPGNPGTILCEEYDLATHKGSIKCLMLKGKTIAHEAKIRFPLPGHLSFPFMFAHEGEVYCMPESGEARRLVILRWDGGFKEYAVVLENVNAADSVLFEEGGYFWIAYTDMDIGPSDNLNLCYAKSLQGPWQQHAGNPVKRNPRSSRNAGTPFRIDGVLYRTTQDCEESYGSALRILRVMECTPERFREEEMTHIMPEPGINPDGLHTLSSFGDKCLVDGKRLVFSPTSLVRKIQKRLTIPFKRLKEA